MGVELTDKKKFTMTTSTDPIEEKFFSDYAQVRQLTDIDHENDPEEQPYKSLYTARKLLESLQTHEFSKQYPLTKISIDYQLAVNYKLSNEITLAKNTLTKALEDLEEYEKIELKNDKSQMFAATNKTSGRGGKKGVYGDKKNQPIKVNPIISSTALIKTHILQDYAIVLSTEPEKSL